MKYCVLYPNTGNVNLVKDMGMIPYKLHKLYGYDATIACYRLGEYPYLNKEVKGLKIEFIDKKFKNYSLDGIKFLKKESKNIDILQIFHVTLYSLFYAFKYKRINPNGKIYLKLDCSYKLTNRIKSLNKIQYKILNKYLNKVDLISVEQKILFEELKELLPQQKNKIINIPDGVDFDYLDNIGVKYDFKVKENIILNVARIGSEEKNTPMLLEAFKSIPNIENLNWKLVLVGPIEESFKPYIDNFFQKNPNMKKIVEIKGNIIDRKELFEEYKRAKIFSLTSNFESFGISFVEAAALGCVIVSTDEGIAKELVLEDNGALVEKNDIKGLAKALEKFMKDKNLEDHAIKTYEICRENFDWNIIIKRLQQKLKTL